MNGHDNNSIKSGEMNNPRDINCVFYPESFNSSNRLDKLITILHRSFSLFTEMCVNSNRTCSANMSFQDKKFHIHISKKEKNKSLLKKLITKPIPCSKMTRLI